MLFLPRGNLIQNGGFELGLAFWEVPENTPYTPYRNMVAWGVYRHSGYSSAYFGYYNPDYVSSIYQDVAISPGNTYELDFHVAAFHACAMGFAAEVHWLDDEGLDIGVGLVVPVLNAASACDGQWTLHTGITEESPLGARKARVSFTSSISPVLLDDVLFFKTE